MSRPIFNHILVQDLQNGDVTVVKPYTYSIFTQIPNRLIRVKSSYMVQGKWEIEGFDLNEERTILVRYDHNELVAVQV